MGGSRRRRPVRPAHGRSRRRSSGCPSALRWMSSAAKQFPGQAFDVEAQSTSRDVRVARRQRRQPGVVARGPPPRGTHRQARPPAARRPARRRTGRQCRRRSVRWCRGGRRRRRPARPPTRSQRTGSTVSIIWRLTLASTVNPSAARSPAAPSITESPIAKRGMRFGDTVVVVARRWSRRAVGRRRRGGGPAVPAVVVGAAPTPVVAGTTRGGGDVGDGRGRRSS